MQKVIRIEMGKEYQKAREGERENVLLWASGAESFYVAFIGLHKYDVIFSNGIKLMIKIVQRDVIKYLDDCCAYAKLTE